MAQGDKNLSLISAGVAFFGILAVFPGLAALIAIFGLFSDPILVDQQLDLLVNIVPKDAFALIDGQVTSLVTAGSGTLGVATLISIAAALWSARAGVAALMRGLNEVNNAPNRSGLRHYITALALTISLICLAMVALLTIVVIPIALSLFPFQASTETFLTVMRWLMAVGSLFAAIWMLYRFAPNRGSKDFKRIFPGIFFSVLAWAFASWAFSNYLTNFGNYNEVYGSIGAVIALLMWLYLSSYLILLGAVINVQIDQHSAWMLARTKRFKDETVG